MISLRLGTRGSRLALQQAQLVAERLTRHHGTRCEFVIIKTSGDRLAESPLSEAGGKRLFVKEIEEALSQGDIDIAVHSCKDMPVELANGLDIAAVLPRADPSDAVVLPASTRLASTTFRDITSSPGSSPRVGTSSVRRVAQLTAVWKQARFEPIRGNLDTRLRKLDEGEYDLLVLASAGLERLGRADRIGCQVPVTVCVPAPGQGVIAVEARTRDDAIHAMLRSINDEATMAAVTAERALVVALGGGCQTPLGALAIPHGDELHLHAAVASLDGQRLVRGEAHGRLQLASDLGVDLAARLAREGAGDILREAERRG